MKRKRNIGLLVYQFCILDCEEIKAVEEKARGEIVMTTTPEFLELLNRHSDALIVIFTFVVTLSTVCYAALTWRLVSETRKLREVQTEPKIHITLESLDFAINIVRLKIKNIGLGPASDLQFDPTVISGGQSAEKLLQDFIRPNFFETGLHHFGPGQSIHSRDTQITDDFEGKSASRLSFKLRYKSATGKKYNEEIIIDMSEIKGASCLGKPNLYSIANSLEKMQMDIGHIVSGFKRLNVDMYSSDDRGQAREAMKKRLEEQNKQGENS